VKAERRDASQVRLVGLGGTCVACTVTFRNFDGGERSGRTAALLQSVVPAEDRAASNSAGTGPPRSLGHRDGDRRDVLQPRCRPAEGRFSNGVLAACSSHTMKVRL
jgi:hypothetical protein